MAKNPSDESQSQAVSSPSPEMLKPQDAADNKVAEKSAERSNAPSAHRRHSTYRPSHKATFVGLGVVVLILAVNAAAIAFVMRRQDSGGVKTDRSEVVLSSESLNALGLSRNAVANEGVVLEVGPDSRFGGRVEVGGDVSIAGQLQLNSRFTASEASLTQLEAGNTSLAELNVNGNGTVSNLNVRESLVVDGGVRLQGAVTLSQLLTVNNGINVSGNVAVGGVLSVGGFQTSILAVDSTLTIGGHIITRGAAPGVTAGPAVGSSGTVSISGSDAAGTVAVNTGVGASSGIVANVTFRRAYVSTPRVVITAVGPGAGSVYVNRSANGFSIGVENAMAPGGHAFDFIVMQ